MTPLRPFRALVLFLLAVLLYPALSIAQAPVEPGQLPSHTTFYLLWRGAPSGEVRSKNSLFSLWDDPDFAPARASFFASLLTQDQKQKEHPALTHEEAAEYVTLLDNPFLVGYLRRPEQSAAAKSPNTQGTPTWNGMFFIYDRTGKEELLSKAVVRMRGTETEIPKLTNLTVAGVPALKVERKAGTTYWAEFSKYAVSAQEYAVFEEILNLLNGKPIASSLSQAAAYQEAKPLLDGGVIEFFLNVSNFVPDLGVDTAGTGSATAQLKPFLTALRFDSIHSVAGHISLEGARTRVQAAVLGDTAPGGLFDIFSEGQANPFSMTFLSPDTTYYNVSQFDLLALYNTLKRAFQQAGGTTGQAPNLLEAAAQTRLGMPLPDALGLITGEIASLQTSPTLEDTQRVYFLGIRKKDDALKLARSLMGDRITSEHNEGDATFLKISLQGSQNSAGVAQWNFYYLAMTPNALLGSSKSETLHTYLAQKSASPLPKSFQTVRAQFPEKLNGMTFVDFQKLDWPALKAKWIAEANKSAEKTKPTDAAKTQSTLPGWLSQVNPDVIPRHLHTLAGASWKDAKGAHFDQWLE